MVLLPLLICTLAILLSSKPPSFRKTSRRMRKQAPEKNGAQASPSGSTSLPPGLCR